MHRKLQWPSQLCMPYAFQLIRIWMDLQVAVADQPALQPLYGLQKA